MSMLNQPVQNGHQIHISSLLFIPIIRIHHVELIFFVLVTRIHVNILQVFHGGKALHRPKKKTPPKKALIKTMKAIRKK